MKKRTKPPLAPWRRLRATLVIEWESAAPIEGERACLEIPDGRLYVMEIAESVVVASVEELPSEEHGKEASDDDE